MRRLVPVCLCLMLACEPAGRRHSEAELVTQRVSTEKVASSDEESDGNPLQELLEQSEDFETLTLESISTRDPETRATPIIAGVVGTSSKDLVSRTRVSKCVPESACGWSVEATVGPDGALGLVEWASRSSGVRPAAALACMRAALVGAHVEEPPGTSVRLDFDSASCAGDRLN